jgi:hypothetical protein
VTAPSSKELGQTQDAKELVPGNVEHIEANISTVAKEHTRIDTKLDAMKRVRVPGWHGMAQGSWEGSYDVQVARWKGYLKHLAETRDALKGYSGAVTAAQTKAGTAIEKWNQAKKATSDALDAHHAAVAAYNRSLDDPVHPGQPQVRPAHPGEFVDPGKAKREEAQEILDEARSDLADAGDEATEKLQNVDGAKTEVKHDWWGTEHKFESPRLKLPWEAEGKTREHTWGTDPAQSIFLASLGEGTLGAWIFKSSGSYEDYFGPVKTNAEYSALVGAEGKYRAKVDQTGLHAGGELFAGGKVTGTAGTSIGGLGGNATVEGWAGAGAAADLDVGYDKGKVTLGGHAGLGLGLGGKVGGDITLDIPEVVETGGDVVESIGGMFS